MVEKEAFDSILALINAQLEAHGILVKTGVKIDATITDSPRKPRGKTTYEIAEDRKKVDISSDQLEKQDCDIKLVKIVQPGVDTEGRWIKKGGKSRFGYKKHILADNDGLVLSETTTSTNVHNSEKFKLPIQKSGIGKGTRVLADKAYKSKDHDAYLKEKETKKTKHTATQK